MYKKYFYNFKKNNFIKLLNLKGLYLITLNVIYHYEDENFITKKSCFTTIKKEDIVNVDVYNHFWKSITVTTRDTITHNEKEYELLSDNVNREENLNRITNNNFLSPFFDVEGNFNLIEIDTDLKKWFLSLNIEEEYLDNIIETFEISEKLTFSNLKTPRFSENFNVIGKEDSILNIDEFELNAALSEISDKHIAALIKFVLEETRT